jgi:two-component system, NarL family, sensor kinase
VDRAGRVETASLVLLASLVVATAGAVAFTGAEVLEGAVARLLGFSFVLAIAFAGVAYAVARNDPDNRVATVAAAVGWCSGLALVLERYTVLGASRGWPAITWTLWVSQWVWMPAILTIPTLLPLRFPHGSLPSPRWRVVEVAALIGIVVATLGIALTPYGVLDFRPAVPLDNPVGTAAGVTIHLVGAFTAAAAAVAGLGSFVLRLVRARGVERAQLLWPVAGLAGAIVLVATGAALGPGGAPVSLLGAALLPASLAVAVLRHGLWDVRWALGRSLVYAGLSVVVLGVYVTTVAMLGGALGERFGAPLVATVIVAVGAEPLRRRLQQLSNRIVYGDRDDPYAALSRLGARLDGAGDRATLLTEAAATVATALRLRSAAIVVEGEVVTQVGTLGPHALELSLRSRGEPVGVLRVGLRPGVELMVKDRRLLLDLASHVAAVVHAERLQAQVEESRARLVSAREEERRRVRRDLHDGLGPTLAGIGLDVERTGVAIRATDPVAADHLDDLAARLRVAVRDVRHLVEGLRPAALDELGLVGALGQVLHQLEAAPTLFTLDTHGDLEGLSAAVDLAAFRIVSEAVTNVVRHAAASCCLVSLRRVGDHLEVIVEDDGRGLTTGADVGVGHHSMAERAHELGGTLTLAPHPPHGTRVEARLPVATP